MNELKKEILIILNGFKHGFRYGFKIRMMHCVVMAVLFFKGSLKDRIKKIFNLTKEHSIKLGSYVALYKFILLILKKIYNNKTYDHHSFISGFIAGYIIFRKNSSINIQLIFYLISRNLHGLGNVLLKNTKYSKINFFPFIAAINWAVVMYLFKTNKSDLQLSLKTSMEYLYEQSEKINSFASLFSI